MYEVTFVVQLHNKQGQLIQLLNIFHQLNINIVNVSFDHTTQLMSQGTIIGTFTIPSKIHYTLNQIKKIPQIEVEHISIS